MHSFLRAIYSAGISAVPRLLPNNVGCAPRTPALFCLLISSVYHRRLFLHLRPADVLSLEVETGCVTTKQDQALRQNTGQSRQ